MTSIVSASPKTSTWVGSAASPFGGAVQQTCSANLGRFGAFGSAGSANLGRFVRRSAVTSSRVNDPKINFFELHKEEYVFVGASSLCKKSPVAHTNDLQKHTLVDVSDELPLYRYLSDAPGGPDSRCFLKVVRMGTLAAIRARVLEGHGVAVLPRYFVAEDLRKRKLVALLPKIRPKSDHFRLVYRDDDPRRALFEAIATIMADSPLRDEQIWAMPVVSGGAGAEVGLVIE